MSTTICGVNVAGVHCAILRKALLPFAEEAYAAIIEPKRPVQALSALLASVKAHVEGCPVSLERTFRAGITAAETAVVDFHAADVYRAARGIAFMAAPNIEGVSYAGHAIFAAYEVYASERGYDLGLLRRRMVDALVAVGGKIE